MCKLNYTYLSRLGSRPYLHLPTRLMQHWAARIITWLSFAPLSVVTPDQLPQLLDLALGVPFLFVVVFAIKTYNFSYSKFLLLPSYVLLPFLPHASLLDSSTAMSSPTLDGVVVGCWDRVGFRWWFDYTHHQRPHVPSRMYNISQRKFTLVSLSFFVTFVLFSL